MIGGYRVLITTNAKYDIYSIYNYILYKFGLDYAVNTKNLIKEKIMSLKLVPKSGTLYWKAPWKDKGLRIVHIENYTIFYFVFDEQKNVKVVKVAYSSMNFDELLNVL